MAQIPKGRLVDSPYKPICRDCAIYFSITVSPIQNVGDVSASQVSFLGVPLKILMSPENCWLEDEAFQAEWSPFKKNIRSISEGGGGSNHEETFLKNYYPLLCSMTSLNKSSSTKKGKPGKGGDRLQLSHGKKKKTGSLTFHEILGCLIGILIMVYCSPHI